MDKCGHTFEFANGKLVVYLNSIIVGSGVLYDGLYMLNLNDMSVNSVIGRKRSRVDEIPLCYGIDVWEIFLDLRLRG